MCNLWIYQWEMKNDKLRDHTDVQFLNLTAGIKLGNSPVLHHLTKVLESWEIPFCYAKLINIIYVVIEKVLEKLGNLPVLRNDCISNSPLSH